MGKIEQILLLDSLKVTYICQIDCWAILYICLQLFWVKSLPKMCLYVHEKLQRKPSIRIYLVKRRHREGGGHKIGKMCRRRLWMAP